MHHGPVSSLPCQGFWHMRLCRILHHQRVYTAQDGATFFPSHVVASWLAGPWTRTQQARSCLRSVEESGISWSLDLGVHWGRGGSRTAEIWHYMGALYVQNRLFLEVWFGRFSRRASYRQQGFGIKVRGQRQARGQRPVVFTSVGVTTARMSTVFCGSLRSGRALLLSHKPLGATQ